MISHDTMRKLLLSTVVLVVIALLSVIFSYYDIHVSESVHAIIELSALGAIVFALIQYADARHHSIALQRISAALSTKYIGNFSVYVARVVAEIEKSESCLICTDIVAYSAFSDHALGQQYRNAIAARVGGPKFRVKVVCLDSGARRHFNDRQFTVEIGDWERRKLPAQQDDAFHESLTRLLQRYSKASSTEVSIENLTSPTFLDILEYENASFVRTLTKKFCTETAEQIPLNFWVFDDKHAIFAVPSSLHATDEYGFETSDITLINELKRMHAGYILRAHGQS
jgi:hypothetical protein